MTTTLTLTGTLSAGTYTLTPVAVTPPVVTPPVVTPPATGNTFWLFHNGAFAPGYPGDYSFGTGKIVFPNPAVGASGSVDVLDKGDEGWQPLFPGGNMDLTGYNWVLVSIKPTEVEAFESGMLAVGDIAVPGSTGAVNIMPYGPNPIVVGQWNRYKIPLKLYGTLPIKAAYKIMFLHQNSPNASGDGTEFDSVGFMA